MVLSSQLIITVLSPIRSDLVLTGTTRRKGTKYTVHTVIITTDVKMSTFNVTLPPTNPPVIQDIFENRRFAVIIIGVIILVNIQNSGLLISFTIIFIHNLTPYMCVMLF